VVFRVFVRACDGRVHHECVLFRGVGRGCVSGFGVGLRYSCILLGRIGSMMGYEAVLELIRECGWEGFIESHGFAVPRWDTSFGGSAYLIVLNSRVIRVYGREVFVSGEGPFRNFDMCDPDFLLDFEDFIRGGWVDEDGLP